MMDYVAHFMFFLAAVFFIEACVRFFMIYKARALYKDREAQPFMPAGVFLAASFMAAAIGSNIVFGQEKLQARLVPKDEDNTQRQISSLAFSATGRTELKEIHPVKIIATGQTQRYWLQHYYNGAVIDMGGNFYVPDSGRKSKLRDNEQFLAKIKGAELMEPMRSQSLVYVFYKRKAAYNQMQKCLLFEKTLSSRISQQDYNGYLVGDFCYDFDRDELDPIAIALMKSARIRHKLPAR